MQEKIWNAYPDIILANRGNKIMKISSEMLKIATWKKWTLKCLKKKYGRFLTDLSNQGAKKHSSEKSALLLGAWFENGLSVWVK